jgi:ATP-dependent phosphofructokinase / diphosphate-dependent phosphofructokinase
VPEAPLTEDKFLMDVDRVYSKLGRCVIAVSEGISVPEKNAKGQHLTWAEKMSQNLEKDAHGNVQLSGTGALADYLAALITKKLNNPGGKKLRVRADTFGYLQRSFPGYVSPSDAEEARFVGRMAVYYSSEEQNLEGSVAMRRAASEEYKIDTFLTPLASVARETKHLNPEFIKDGNDITQAFIKYARPLVGPLPTIGSFAEV